MASSPRATGSTVLGGSSPLLVTLSMVGVLGGPSAGCGDDGRALCAADASADAAEAGGLEGGGGATAGGGGGLGQGGRGLGGAGGQAGGTASQVDAGVASIPLEELGRRSLDAICAYAVRCAVFPDAAACAGTIYARLQVFADVGTGKVIYDGRAAAACVDWYAQRGCTLADLETSSAACGLVFTGTLPDGSGCLANNECQSNSCNRAACGASTCCQGTCQMVVAVGGDCSRDGQVCARGAFCKADALGLHPTCTSRVLPGQPCDTTDVCVPGQFCNVDLVSGKGLCSPTPSEGEACPNGLCGSIVDTCDLSSSLCTAKRPIGGPCFTDLSCVNYGRCDPDTFTCVARVRAGGACASSADCISGLPCQSGTCVSPQDVPACP